MAARPQSGSRTDRPSRTKPPDCADAATAPGRSSPRRASSLALSPRAMNQRRRAETLENVDQHHRPARGLDDLMADDLLAGVIAPLDQRTRLDAGDQVDRRIFIENNDEIDGFERRQHFRTRSLVLNGAIGALQPPYRSVAVQPHDQAVAGGARRCQHLDVAGMQDVEAAIGEADALALLLPFRELRVERAGLEHDLLLGREIGMRQYLSLQLGRTHAGGALLADGDGGRGTGHA